MATLLHLTGAAILLCEMQHFPVKVRKEWKREREEWKKRREERSERRKEKSEKEEGREKMKEKKRRKKGKEKMKIRRKKNVWMESVDGSPDKVVCQPSTCSSASPCIAVAG